MATIGQPQQDMQDPALSPEGNWVAISAGEQGSRDIWLHDVKRGNKRRLSFSEETDLHPNWTALGDQVAFHANFEAGLEIWIRPADNSSDAAKLTDGLQAHFSSDGRFLVFARNSQELDRDLWYTEVGKKDEPKPFLVTEHREARPRLSAGSRWVAYTSDASGQSQIYVKKFPSGEGLWQISTDGGDYPRWSSDGDELFYLQDRDLMVVSVQGTNSFDHGRPTRLFALP